jgi:superoxide dismutase
MPLSNNLQSPLSSAPLSPLLPSNGYPNRYLDKYSNSDMDYLNNKLNSDAIKAL